MRAGIWTAGTFRGQAEAGTAWNEQAMPQPKGSRKQNVGVIFSFETL
jgi:hypothetical protein